MKALIKFVVILGAFFTCTLLVFKLFDVLSVDEIKLWLSQAQQLSVWAIGSLIIFLLVIDLFIAVPTLSLTIFSGFFLGMEYGLLFSTIGMLLAGSMGYLLSKYKGERILNFVSKDQQQIQEMTTLFKTYGPISLILCRAAPMLPEVTSCLAGITKMPYLRYLLFYVIGTLPYAIIAVYAGSVSTVDNPQPALYTFIGLFGGLSIIWLIFIQYNRKKMQDSSSLS
ncbi:MAG: VTT domain-containing protein [Balneolaceae bacterium]